MDRRRKETRSVESFERGAGKPRKLLRSNREEIGEAILRAIAKVDGAHVATHVDHAHLRVIQVRRQPRGLGKEFSAYRTLGHQMDTEETYLAPSTFRFADTALVLSDEAAHVLA